MAATLVPKVKLFLADYMVALVTPDGNSLEERMNAFLATVPTANILDVQVNLNKSGKFGENFMFAGSVLYKV